MRLLNAYSASTVPMMIAIHWVTIRNQTLIRLPTKVISSSL